MQIFFGGHDPYKGFFFFLCNFLKKITKKKGFWSGFAIFRALVLVSHQTIVGLQK
jgi:hypothetical protein